MAVLASLQVEESQGSPEAVLGKISIELGGSLRVRSVPLDLSSKLAIGATEAFSTATYFQLSLRRAISGSTFRLDF